MKLRSLIDQFLLSYRGRLKPSTLTDYRSILTRHLAGFGTLEAANHGRFEDYLSGLPVSGKRRNNILSAVSTFVAWAQRRGHWRGQWSHIPRFRAVCARTPPLTAQETWLMLTRSTPPYRDFFIVALTTGARTGELRALKFHDFDTRRGLVHIRRAWSGREISTTKTGRSRQAPLTAAAAAVYRRRRRADPRAEWFFYGRGGRGVMSYSAIRRAWLRDLARLGIQPRPLYATRHTFASLAIAAGEDPLWVAQVLGHSRPDTLFLRYASYLEGVKRDGEKFELLLAGQQKRAIRVVK